MLFLRYYFHISKSCLVKLHGADVVEVPEQREQAPPQLVVPHLDLVVIACSGACDSGEG